MTDTSPVRKRYAGTIDGEPAQLMAPESGQMAAIGRSLMTLEANSSSIMDRMEAVVLAEDVVLSLIEMDDEAMKKLKKKLARGEATMESLISQIVTQTTGNTAPTTGPVKAVRRGRPRKSV
jgi:hypothetical protein